MCTMYMCVFMCQPLLRCVHVHVCVHVSMWTSYLPEPAPVQCVHVDVILTLEPAPVQCVHVDVILTLEPAPVQCVHVDVILTLEPAPVQCVHVDVILIIPAPAPVNVLSSLGGVAM